MHQAPEVLEHNFVSKAADVYSFGVLLWQVRGFDWFVLVCLC